VLRIGNVVGYDRAQRRSFMTSMLGSLAAEGRVVLDVSPFVRRDFLPVEQVAAALKALLNQGGTRDGVSGIFNVGSGTAVEVGRLVLWVIEGYGRGALVVNSPRIHDEFVLDVGRLAAVTGWQWSAGALAEYCRSLGRRLAKAES